MSIEPQSGIDDAAQLAALGYTGQFERTMTLWENFSLGFTYLSPVVGVYSVLALALQAGGPPMLWTYLLIGAGQLLVCLVFGEVVSQFPIAGGLYPWARRLVGKRWAWMAGWIYLWALCSTIAAVATGRAIRRAMRMTIYIGGAAAMFVCLALVMAVPDMAAALSGKDADPVATALKTALGNHGFKAVAAIVLVSFFSCLLSLQAAASRLLYAYARDEMIVGSGTLSKLSSRHVPTAALWVCGLAPAAISVGGYFLENALKTIVIFGSVGIYIGFQMVVLGALFARWRGWTPGGKFRLG